MSQSLVCALYKFVPLPDFASLREPLLGLMDEHQIFGTLLLAKEGINGTVAGPKASIERLLDWFDTQPNLANIVTKFSTANICPFNRSKVKLKKEIVTMGVCGIDPNQVVGTYVKPSEWNDLITQDDVTLIDTRNDYEVAIGTFKGALDPKTTNFRDFPEYVSQHLDKKKHKKVAMFCTGGIRCEKSTAYLKEQGFDEVYHLEGGILNYLASVDEKESLWRGECFVFDERVSVNHQLEKGQYAMCHACRMPITEEEMQHPHYEQGISCPHCHGKHNEAQLQRFKEREYQNQLALKRGEAHIGKAVREVMVERKNSKAAEKARLRKITS